MKAIVLCGGYGTRLGSLTQNLPKAIIHVAGRPFIEYVLDQLITYPFDEIVLAVSFKWQAIRECVGDQWKGVTISYSTEAQPLGTGGAIKQAMNSCQIKAALVVNGDTLFAIKINEFLNFAFNSEADITVALTQVNNSARYGSVLMHESGRILSFQEKNSDICGLINSGMYYVKASIFESTNLHFFSFENDILAKSLGNLNVYGMYANEYFIDIGVPEDLLRAQVELSNFVTKRT